jgi:hypothetical protein
VVVISAHIYYQVNFLLISFLLGLRDLQKLALCPQNKNLFLHANVIIITSRYAGEFVIKLNYELIADYNQWSLLVLVAVGVVLKFAGPVLLPLIIAWLLSYLIGPAVNFMTQRKIPTTLAAFVILILLLGVFYLSGTFLYSRFSAFVAAYPEYHSRFTELIAMVSSQWNLEYGEQSMEFGV